MKQQKASQEAQLADAKNQQLERRKAKTTSIKDSVQERTRKSVHDLKEKKRAQVQEQCAEYQKQIADRIEQMKLYDGVIQQEQQELSQQINRR